MSEATRPDFPEFITLIAGGRLARCEKCGAGLSLNIVAGHVIELHGFRLIDEAAAVAHEQQVTEAKTATQIADLWYAMQTNGGCKCDPVGSGEEYCTGHCYARENGKLQGLEEAAAAVSALLPGMTGVLAATTIRALKTEAQL